MRIGVNTRFLLASKMEGFGWYTYEVVKRLVEQHPEHTFVFFFDRPFDPKFIFGPNVEPVVIGPPARHPVLFYWWFNFSISKALKEHRIDVFFSPDGYLSLRTDTPQVPVIHDLNFEHFPQDIPRQPRWYLRHFFPKFARKAAHILTVSHYSKQDICTTYDIPEHAVTVGWNGAADEFRPLETSVIQHVRKTYTDGKPYFIFVGALHPRKNVGRLIAAFAAFAEEHPETDLLVVGEALWKNKALNLPEVDKAIRSRIHFTGHVSLEQLTELVGAAFALVYVPYFEGFGIPLAEAMKCGIPIIAGNRTSLPEVAGDAALYCDPFSVEEITAQMEQMVVDTALHTSLSEKSLERGKLFSWDRTAETCWEVIQTAVKSQ